MIDTIVKAKRSYSKCVRCNSNLFVLKGTVIFDLKITECIFCEHRYDMSTEQYEVFGNNKKLIKILYETS